MRSTNGVLRVELNVQVAEIEIDWMKTMRRTYNGKLNSDVWLVHRNDTILLKIVSIKIYFCIKFLKLCIN